jgi:hypothetical protein
MSWSWGGAAAVVLVAELQAVAMTMAADETEMTAKYEARRVRRRVNRWDGTVTPQPFDRRRPGAHVVD